jgi:hypothetical protein
MTTGHQGFTTWPERFLALGLVLGAVAMFTPWWAYTYPYPGWNGFGELVRMESAQINGFGNWGILYLLSLLVVGALLFMRSRWGGHLSELELPVDDWFIYGWSAVLMGISAVAA